MKCSFIAPLNKLCSGVGEGGGGGGGAGHDCTLKFNEEKISSSSMSASIGAIARLIYNMLSKFLPQIVPKAVSEHKNMHAPRPP